MPGYRRALGERTAPGCHGVCWDQKNLYLDSLARMQLATAAATWCNAYDAGFEDLFLARRSSMDWADVMLRARLSGARHFTFATSGSTGARKFIRHQEEMLAAEAQTWVKVLQRPDIGAPAAHIKRVVVLAPTHHIYGFIWGVLLPKALGVEALDADISAMPPLQTGDLLVAVPDQWAWLAGAQKAPSGLHAEARKQTVWPDYIYGASSTAPLPAAVHAQLATQLMAGQPRPALTALLQIYGSSETAGLGWRADPGRPYTLAPERIRNSEGGISLQLAAGAEVTLKVQDELNWLGDRDFELVRRADECVQVGGHNVWPAWVEAQLMRHPAVKEASVRLNDKIEPRRLKAFVVLRTPDSTNERRAFEEWAAQSLPAYAAPCAVSYGNELPRNLLGKASDWPDS